MCLDYPIAELIRRLVRALASLIIKQIKIKKNNNNKKMNNNKNNNRKKYKAERQPVKGTSKDK